MREIVKGSQGGNSMMLNIHQPNPKILALFDHILIMENGACVYFGTLPDSISHFSSLGHICQGGVTPTDFFLQITDSKFSESAGQQDFVKVRRYLRIAMMKL
jgi:ABC-type multidrug transport system ATPase subunit